MSRFIFEDVVKEKGSEEPFYKSKQEFNRELLRCLQLVLLSPPFSFQEPHQES